jgi:3-deoxy-D-manno-octulosonate 8-phosphate phosphatase (KDO 8-P phosphatase)
VVSKVKSKKTKLSKKTLSKKASKIKLLLLDVDGVLTEGGVYMMHDDDSGIKGFDVKDGFGITLAQIAGIEIGIITGRRSQIVERRAKMLDIKILYQGHFNKLPYYEELKEKYNFQDNEIAYIGDDLFDLPVLQCVGLSAAPADAIKEVRAAVDFVTKNPGGRGAVRELIEFILGSQGKTTMETLDKYLKTL